MSIRNMQIFPLTFLCLRTNQYHQRYTSTIKFNLSVITTSTCINHFVINEIFSVYLQLSQSLLLPLVPDIFQPDLSCFFRPISKNPIFFFYSFFHFVFNLNHKFFLNSIIFHFTHTQNNFHFQSTTESFLQII